MSANQFIKDYRSYFTDHDLSPYDEKRLLEIHQRHTKERIIKQHVPVERIVYRDRVIVGNRTILEKPVEAAVAPVDINSVIRDICRIWDVTPAAVRSKKRIRRLVAARQHICLVLRQAGITVTEIGKAINRDHTTAIHSISVALDLLDQEDPLFTSCYHKYKTHGLQRNS